MNSDGRGVGDLLWAACGAAGAALSYHQNHDIGFAILHSIIGPIYCAYWLVEYGHILDHL